jgi:hypothetical protein
MPSIPERFEVDVSSLLMGESIHVREIAVPEGIEVPLPESKPLLLF